MAMRNPPRSRDDELLAAIQRLREENDRLRAQNEQLRRSIQASIRLGLLPEPMVQPTPAAA